MSVWFTTRTTTPRDAARTAAACSRVSVVIRCVMPLVARGLTAWLVGFVQVT
eukprot:CAMPEP_0198312968 /NCGR_PEP_ID=MMETSP1450-20131203/4151_1 /TAXON_ID=753684 ORGANISM="Madagascaria erythrocladiodes, Strain CCMP3234" /NCGR_SAMPLE_ID=MMETSP1450 /ASSEMBLY_ACC=CAM_ASM_001115 /LENGTH=51 /DNA_ID=CAMNT_0044015937 /DNA_START=47 /DNA_END=198 /DNA_ORIENTATION=-